MFVDECEPQVEVERSGSVCYGVSDCERELPCLWMLEDLELLFQGCL
jgi:hypothetical protein